MTQKKRNYDPRLFIGLMSLLGIIASNAFSAGIDQADLVRAEQLYQRECASCHGVEGDGDGPGAYILAQRPRNFQLGVFKLRSTITGENPSDEDLFSTITRGIAGSTGAMMPNFASLSEQDRWSLVAHIKKIAEIDSPGKPMHIPPQPAKVDIASGQKVYERLECNDCHGSSGHGDGSSALTLEDDQKRRIWPPDLTKGLFKGGNEPTEIYERIVTGMDGSPMPSYATKATQEEIWALTMYVLSLSKDIDKSRQSK